MHLPYPILLALVTTISALVTPSTISLPLNLTNRPGDPDYQHFRVDANWRQLPLQPLDCYMTCLRAAFLLAGKAPHTPVSQQDYQHPNYGGMFVTVIPRDNVVMETRFILWTLLGATNGGHFFEAQFRLYWRNQDLGYVLWSRDKIISLNGILNGANTTSWPATTETSDTSLVSKPNKTSDLEVQARGIEVKCEVIGAPLQQRQVFVVLMDTINQLNMGPSVPPLLATSIWENRDAAARALVKINVPNGRATQETAQLRNRDFMGTLYQIPTYMLRGADRFKEVEAKITINRRPAANIFVQNYIPPTTPTIITPAVER